MNLLKALVLYVERGYPAEKKNIGEVYHLLTMSSEKELNALFDVLPVSHPAKVPYPYNQWQEILGNCDITLFLGCTDALPADFISVRTGETSIAVTSKAKQLGTWRISNYTPEYRETSGVGKRKLMTMDEAGAWR